MVNSPLIRPAIFWGFYVALGGSGPLGSHDSREEFGILREFPLLIQKAIKSWERELTYPIPRHFWVDDFQTFPRSDMMDFCLFPGEYVIPPKKMFVKVTLPETI